MYKTLIQIKAMKALCLESEDWFSPPPFGGDAKFKTHASN